MKIHKKTTKNIKNNNKSNLIHYINCINLDLEYVEKKLVNNLGWSSKKAKEGIRRYKNFLLLILKYPKIHFSPTRDIDEVWHNHILFTREYHQDCMKIFGKYLHHSPIKYTGTKEKQILQKAGERASELYFQEFHEQYIPGIKKA